MIDILKKYIGETKDNLVNREIYIVDSENEESIYLYGCLNRFDKKDFVDITLDEHKDFLIKFAQKIYDDTNKELEESKKKVSGLEMKILGYKVILEYLKNDRS